MGGWEEKCDKEAIEFERFPPRRKLTHNICSKRKFTFIFPPLQAFNEISEATEALKMGTFNFRANATSCRTFKFDRLPATPYKYMKIEFHENNGNPDKTCVYRLRVHGVLR